MRTMKTILTVFVLIVFAVINENLAFSQDDQTLEKMAVDAAGSMAMGGAGADRIRAAYSFEKYVEKLVVLYRQAAAPWQKAGS